LSDGRKSLATKESDGAQLGDKSLDRGLHRQGILLLAILFLGYAVYAADRLVLSAVLKPMSISLGLSDLQKGLLSSAQYIGVAAVVFMAGSLSDRYGARRIILLGIVVFTGFTWIVAFSADFAQAFVFRLVSGLGEGLFWPVAMAFVANYFRARKGFALGIFYVGFDVGQASGLFIGGSTYASTGDWRTAFLVAPVLGVAVIAGLLFAGSAFASADTRVGRVALGREAFALVKRRSTALIMAFALLATWASVWVVVFLPYYYATSLGASVAVADYLTAGVAVAGAAGKVILGTISDRVRRDRMLALISAGVVGLYALFFTAANIEIAALTALAMGFLSSAVFPIVQSLMADSCGSQTGTGLGLTTSAQSVATVFAPTINAYLFYLGVGRALALDAMIPALLMLVVAFFLGDPRLSSAPPQRASNT
jgi:MFS transporter, ACS family, aldohexuronate transporter